MRKLLYLSLSTICILMAISCGSDTDENEEVIVIEPDPKPIPQKPACESGEKTVFIEKEGLVVVEMESVAKTGPWSFTTNISGFSGDGYLLNTNDYLTTPGNGTLTYTIRITNPGTYRFIWRSRISAGNSFTDLNDNWLRIPDAKHFYGRKDSSIVYPNGTTLDPLPTSTEYSTGSLEGNSSQGWFKIYMNSLNSWTWKACTSDNDPHSIFVVFDVAGDYTVEISARSKGHAIDKFVLFNEDVSESTATANSAPTSSILCE